MTTMYGLPEFFQERDLDNAEYNARGPNEPFALPPLTARAIAVRREFFRKRNAHKAPAAQLPEKYIERGPQLHFGVPIWQDQYLQFALDHGLVEPRPNDEDDPLTYWECGPFISRHLRDEIQAFVYMARVYSDDDDVVLVALFHNHIPRKRWPSERTQKKIVEAIHQKFGVTSAPMWYWDKATS